MYYNFSNVSLVKQNTLSALDLDHPEITDYFDDYVEDHNVERLKARNHDNINYLSKQANIPRSS